jgi:chromate transporter
MRHRDNPQLRAFVRGATAAASGAIGGAAVIIARDAVHDVATMAIAVACALLILRFKAKEPAVVALAGAAGLLLY